MNLQNANLQVYEKKTLSHILLHVFCLLFFRMHHKYFLQRGFESVRAQFLSGNISISSVTRSYWQVPPTHFSQNLWPLRFVASNIVVKIFSVRPANCDGCDAWRGGKMDPNVGFSNPFSTWMKLWSVTICYLNTLNLPNLTKF